MLPDLGSLTSLTGGGSMPSASSNGDYGASGPSVGGISFGASAGDSGLATSDKLLLSGLFIFALIIWAVTKK